MNILIVAATAFEIQPAIDRLQTTNFRIHENEFSILITGIGGVATTYQLTKCLREKKPDHIIQAGIAGSFHTEIIIGSVVCVQEELMGDLGVEEGNEFKDVFDLALIKENEFPFIGKILKNPFITAQTILGLRLVRSIGINEITTRRERIDVLRNKYNPDIESMEGAAFHYVCLQEKIPFLQLRAISNYIGERNKENWNIKEAIKTLNTKIMDIAGSSLLQGC